MGPKNNTRQHDGNARQHHDSYVAFLFWNFVCQGDGVGPKNKAGYRQHHETGYTTMICDMHTVIIFFKKKMQAGEMAWGQRTQHDNYVALLFFHQGDGAGPKTLETAAREAKEHLDTFWLVGVIEQYEGFIAVLKHMMDPLRR